MDTLEGKAEGRDFMFQILDIYWRTKNQGESYYTEIRIYDSLEESIKSFELSNYTFNFKLSAKRYCTGYYKDGEYHLCKLADENGIGLELDSGFEQCRICEKIQGFKSAFFFQGEVNENAKQHLSQNHFIYLAYFEPGIIKVGTAAESRKLIRPIEQDGLIYSYIAQSDGFNIQKLERFISKNIGITEYVKSGHKFKYLDRVPSTDSASDLIKSSFQKVVDLVSNNSEFEGWLFDSIQITDLTNQKAIYYPPSKPALIKFQNDGSSDFLSGQYLGLRGRYLILENYGKIVAFDTQGLIGRTFNYDESNFEYKVESDDQMGFSF